MHNLRFEIAEAKALEHTATPVIALSVEARSDDGARIESVLLRIQARIEASRRPHSEVERERIREVFGENDVWSRSSKSLLWAQETVVIPGFESTAMFEVHLPCGYDFASAATKYLHGVESGVIPIRLSFSGTIFLRGAEGLGVAPLPWDREASFSLPVGLIRQVIDRHFPGSAVVPLGRDVFDRLDRYRREQGLSTWTDAVGRLLSRTSNGGPS